MRALKIGSFLALSGAMLMMGCGNGVVPYTKKAPEQISTTVVINNCTATPDTAVVFVTDTLTFTSSDGNTYDLSFKGTPPVSTGSFPVSSKPASHPVKQSFGCWLTWNNCYYTYTLKKNNVSCPDPGIHIIPGGP